MGSVPVKLDIVLSYLTRIYYLAPEYKRMAHTIDITDIRNMVVQQVLASAYNKILLFEYTMYDNAHCWKVIYSNVTHNSEDVYHNLTDAVNAYNALR